jgi:hypothetical protein
MVSAERCFRMWSGYAHRKLTSSGGCLSLCRASARGVSCVVLVPQLPAYGAGHAAQHRRNRPQRMALGQPQVQGLILRPSYVDSISLSWQHRNPTARPPYLPIPGSICRGLGARRDRRPAAMASSSECVPIIPIALSSIGRNPIRASRWRVMR